MCSDRVLIVRLFTGLKHLSRSNTSSSHHAGFLLREILPLIGENLVVGITGVNHHSDYAM